MEYHCLPILLVICILIASGSCGYRHYRDHDDDHQHVARRGHDHHEHHDSHHQDSHQFLYAKIHHQSPFGHPNHPPGHGIGRGFQHGYGMHGYGHGPYLGHFGHGFRGDDSSSSDEDDDDHRQHHRRRHAFGHHDRDHHEEESSKEENEDQHDHRIWRFQIGDNFGAYEYLDHNGHALGFHIDLMRAVCKRAWKRCYFVVDAYHNCWNTQGGQELPGIGLMDHYYDGCIGNLPTPDRLNSFNFTLPFAPDVKCGLLYKPGTEQTSAQAHNVTGKKIGFVDGWALSKRCFERQPGYEGNAPGVYTAVVFETHKGMLRALLQNEIDAVLTVDAFDSDKMKVSLVEPTFSCTLRGSSVMTLYGSEVLDWWNVAFLAMKADGTFERECDRSQREHSHKGRVTCLT